MNTIDYVLKSTAHHLWSEKNCSSLQQRLEFHALRMHSSFLLAETCRPFLRYDILRQQEQAPDQTLHDRGVRSMREVVQTYIDTSKISILPLRSWSLTHEALSCACVLAMFSATHVTSDTPLLLRAVYKLLQSELDSEGDSPNHQSWALSRGLQLLKFLQERGSSYGDESSRISSDQSLSQDTPDQLSSNALPLTFPSNPMPDSTNDSWLDSLFGETGLEIPLPSFLDQPFDFFADL